MRNLIKPMALLAALLLVLARPAAGQDLASMYSSNVFQQSVIEMGRPTLEAGQGRHAGSEGARTDLTRAAGSAFSAPAAGEASARVLGRFEFSRDAAVSRDVQSRLLDVLVRMNPDARDYFNQVMTSGQIMREFDAMIAPLGYSSTNLADVMAVHLMLAWEMVNQRESASQPQGQLAIRHQLATTLAATEIDEARRQELAETLAYQTMLYAAIYQQLNGLADRSHVDRFSRDLARGIEGSLGVDLASARLTEGGFVTR